MLSLAFKKKKWCRNSLLKTKKTTHNHKPYATHAQHLHIASVFAHYHLQEFPFLQNHFFVKEKGILSDITKLLFQMVIAPLNKETEICLPIKLKTHLSLYSFFRSFIHI